MHDNNNVNSKNSGRSPLFDVLKLNNYIDKYYDMIKKKNFFPFFLTKGVSV